MTQQFHEGQDVEVWGANMYPWRKAKIITPLFSGPNKRVVEYQVQFPDGSRSVFDAEHIRDPKVGKAMYEHAAKLTRTP